MRHSSKQSHWGHDMLLLAVFAAAMGLVLTSTSSRADPIACNQVFSATHSAAGSSAA